MAHAHAAAALVARLRAAGCVFAEEEAALLLEAATDAAHLEHMVGRRVAGAPLEHVLGRVEFAGLRLAVDDGVFVPRRRTELLVRVALEHLGGLGRPGVLVEMCCGCAPVATAVATLRPGTEVHASDVDPHAVACARRNLADVGGTAHVGDLDAALPRDVVGRVDVLAANAPYVPSDRVRLMPADARDHEPLVALDGGPDGLRIARAVVDVARRWLAPDGVVVVETSAGQAPHLAEHARHRGLVPRVVGAEDLDATAVVAALSA